MVAIRVELRNSLTVILQNRIRDLLVPLSPDEVFFFGSRSRGVGDDESDIDLMVILPIDELPSNYAEKMKNVRLVGRALADLNREYAMDLLVFTRPEWCLFKEERPLFAAEIVDKGRRIA